MTTLWKRVLLIIYLVINPINYLYLFTYLFIYLFVLFVCLVTGTFITALRDVFKINFSQHFDTF